MKAEIKAFALDYVSRYDNVSCAELQLAIGSRYGKAPRYAALVKIGAVDERKSFALDRARAR
jgi:hypothetical protein